MWPQSSLDDMREAQERANAGDPAYTWQVDPKLASDDAWSYLEVSDPGPEIVDRFMHEQLGWDQYLFLEHEGDFDGDDGDGALDGKVHRRVVYMRCAPGETNPLYPTASCAPTIDDLRYETVSLDIVQPGEQGLTGIWVAGVWRNTAPFAQADPDVSEATATALLEGFLAARIAGEGAEGLVEVSAAFMAIDDVPLLYATTTGAPYERYEIERVGGPHWPDGDMEFEVRMFGDGGATVVEQQIYWSASSLTHNATQTTENGEPLAMTYAFFDGEVMMSAAAPWRIGFERESLDLGDRFLTSGPPEEAILLMSNPLPFATGCANGPAPVDADALARSLESDPDLQVTAPVAVSVGGVDAVAMDVVLAPGASCDAVLDDDQRGWATIGGGSRMRLYLLDMPDGSSTRIMAIAVVAPEARFDSVLEAATPIIDSTEFHAP